MTQNIEHKPNIPIFYEWAGRQEAIKAEKQADFINAYLKASEQFDKSEYCLGYESSKCKKGLENCSPLVSFFVFLLILCVVPISLKAQSDSASEMQPVGAEAFNVMKQFFDYDQTVPRETELINQIKKKGYVREKILFRGALGSKIHGYLALPTSKKRPYPVVLLLHGVTSSKESWWEEGSAMRMLTIQLLESGFAVLSLDAEYHGERSMNNEFESPITLLENERFVEYRDMIIRSTIDYRRGMDYLVTRTEIDTSRIGVVGYSMGGMMTFMLSAVDSRIKTSVACVSPIVTVPFLPTGVHHHAPYIHKVPFLMLMGKNDEQNYTRDQAHQLRDLIGSDTKELVFFDSGHMLPAEWTDQAINWIDKHLN